MTISVLMSVYGAELPSYLNRSIKSIWALQTLKPDQVVLVEDGPLGLDLENVVSSWSKEIGEKMVVIKNIENIGLTSSLNKGLSFVTSDLVARMDSDDESYPNRFLLQHQFLIENPDIDIVGGSMDMVDENGIFKYTRHYPLNHNDISNIIYKVNPLGHSAVMMRTSLFKERGLGYDNRYKFAQDIALWFDALTVGCKFANLPDVVVKFTEKNNFINRKGRLRAKCELLVWSRGIYKTKGLFTWHYIFPILRFFFHSLPLGVVKFFYMSVRRHLNYK